MFSKKRHGKVKSVHTIVSPVESPDLRRRTSLNEPRGPMKLFSIVMHLSPNKAMHSRRNNSKMIWNRDDRQSTIGATGRSSSTSVTRKQHADGILLQRASSANIQQQKPNEQKFFGPKAIVNRPPVEHVKVSDERRNSIAKEKLERTKRKAPVEKSLLDMSSRLSQALFFNEGNYLTVILREARVTNEQIALTQRSRKI